MAIVRFIERGTRNQEHLERANAYLAELRASIQVRNDENERVGSEHASTVRELKNNVRLHGSRAEGSRMTWRACMIRFYKRNAGREKWRCDSSLSCKRVSPSLMIYSTGRRKRSTSLATCCDGLSLIRASTCPITRDLRERALRICCVNVFAYRRQDVFVCFFGRFVDCLRHQSRRSGQTAQ